MEIIVYQGKRVGSKMLEVKGEFFNMQSATDRALIGAEALNVDKPDERYFYVSEIEEAPWIVSVPKPQAQLDQIFNAEVLQKIAALEAGQSRAVREAALGSTARLKAIGEQIAALRATMKVVPK